MRGKLLAAMVMALTGATGAHAGPPYAPYENGAANGIYNLLFCDDRGAFAAAPGTPPVAWQKTLASEPADLEALRALADDIAQDARVRYLAFARLRELGERVPSKILFGVIVEVPLEGGLDTLAAYSDGSVRYINASGKMVVFEGVSLLDKQVRSLFAASEPIVAQIGPWTEARRPPPRAGDIRLSFLVSDGLYFGEGPMDVMQREALAAPIISRAVELLQAVTSQVHK